MAAFVTDSFSGGSDVLLSSHTGEAGATWAQNGSLAGNTLRVSAAGRVYCGNSSNPGGYYASGTPATNEYDVQADLVCLSTGGISGLSAGFGGRYSTGADTGYLVRSNGASWSLFKVVINVATSLGTFSQTLVAGTTYAAKLEIRTAAKKLFVDGVERISSADDSITVVGVPLIRMAGVGESSTAGTHLDNFQASDPAGGSITGTASITLADVTATATGQLVVAGTAAVTLAAATLSAAGTLPLSGSAAVTLGDLSLAAAGGLALSGSAAVALDPAALSGAGVLAGTGTLGVALDDLTLAGTGTLTGGPAGAAAAIILDPVGLSAAGSLAITGAADITLGTLTVTAGGGVPGRLVAVCGGFRLAVEVAGTFAASAELAGSFAIPGC